MADEEGREGLPPEGTMLPGTPARTAQEAPDAVWPRRDKLLLPATVMETLQADLQPLAQARASPGDSLREAAASLREAAASDPEPKTEDGTSFGIPVISWQLDSQLDEMMTSRKGSVDLKSEVRERLVQELTKIGLWTGTSETQPIQTRVAVFQTRTAPNIRVHVQIAARSDQESWPLVSAIQCTSVRCGLAQDTASKDISLLEARRYWRQRFLSEALQRNPGQPELEREKAVQSMQWPEATKEFFVSILMEAVFNALKGVKLPGAQPMPSVQTESLQDFFFPPLYAEDTYADMGCQLSPPEFLNVAAPLWMAVTRSLADTKKELKRLGGLAHLQAALNTPVVYKSSSKRGKLLCGNVLMFVLDSLSQRQSGNRAEQPDVVRSLLDHRADAGSSYGMFPIGTKDSLGEFPVLSLAKDEVVTQLLLDHGAKPDQTSLVNFFPSGSCLWTATWRSSPVLKLLLRYSKGVDNHGWYPDTSPLIPGQEPDGCRVLALAAMTSAEEHMQLLLDKKASLGQDMAHVLAYCPSGNARILTRSLFLSEQNAREIVDGSALRRMSGMRLELFFKEVLNHGPCQKALRAALTTECRDPKRKNPRFLLDQTFQEILTKAPLAAGCLLDFQARPPDVADLNRFPLAQSCFFDVHELQNTAYVGGVQWTNRTEDRAEMFADSLAPPVAVLPWLAGKAETNPYLMLFITGLYSVLPEYRRHHACEITVLRHPNILNPTIMQTLEKLPHEQLVTLFMKSYAFRGIAYHLWTVFKVLCYMDVLITVLQLLSLVVWWRNALSEEVVIACWCLFTAAVLLDASGVLLKLSQLRRPSIKRVLQTGLGFWMSYSTWAASTSSPFRTPMAVNMALGILGGIYELRLFYPLGLPLGSNLVPIMRAAQTSQFMAMLILLMSIIAATYLAACVEFRELGDDLLPVAVRTWQTLIVGESSLYDVDDYEHELPRYLFISALFFVCNVVLMNIFINVTGASYEEERKLECGTFSAERFGTCMEFTGVTSRGRQLVLVLVGLAVLSKAAISLIQGQTRILICEVALLVCFLVLYGVQWFLGMRADRLFDRSGKPRYLWICRAVCQEDEDETEKDEKKPAESPSGPTTSVAETVAHHMPMRRPTVPTLLTGLQHDWLQEFVASMQLDFGKYLELTLQLAEKNSILQSHMLEFLRSSTGQHTDSSQCVLDLPKYLLQTLQWSETNSLVQGELLHFIARCAKDQKSACEYVEQLISRLNLSADDAVHVRKQAKEAWSGGSTAQTD